MGWYLENNPPKWWEIWIDIGFWIIVISTNYYLFTSIFLGVMSINSTILMFIQFLVPILYISPLNYRQQFIFKKVISDPIENSLSNTRHQKIFIDYIQTGIEKKNILLIIDLCDNIASFKKSLVSVFSFFFILNMFIVLPYIWYGYLSINFLLVMANIFLFLVFFSIYILSIKWTSLRFLLSESHTFIETILNIKSYVFIKYLIFFLVLQLLMFLYSREIAQIIINGSNRNLNTVFLILLIIVFSSYLFLIGWNFRKNWIRRMRAYLRTLNECEMILQLYISKEILKDDDWARGYEDVVELLKKDGKFIPEHHRELRRKRRQK